MCRERLEQLHQQLDALRWSQQQIDKDSSTLPSTLSWLESAGRGTAACCMLQRLQPRVNDVPSPLQLSCPSVQELLHMLPMSAMAASAGDKHLHKSIMSLTPKAAAAYWNQAVKDLSMLLYLHERNPTASCQEMRVMVNELLRWSCAVYMFNPTVLQELRDVDLSTMQYQPASASRWQEAWDSASLTQVQLGQILSVRDYTCSRLEALGAERQELQDELAQLDAAAARAAAAGRQLSGEKTADSTDSSSSTDSGLIERRRWEVAQQLACVRSSWKVLTQLRSQLVVMVLEPVQAARVVCSVYPYMLLGGPLYQHLPTDGPQEAACSRCGHASTGSDSRSTAVSRKRPALTAVQHEPLPLVKIHPAWCGVARLPQLQHLPQQVAQARAAVLGRLPGSAATGLTAGPSLAALAGLTSLMHGDAEADIAVVGDNFS